MIKHISFDLWLTLIQSNPKFKPLRVAHFAQYYNPLRKSEAEITQIIRTIDKASDRLNEYSGYKVAATAMYAAIIRRLGFGASEVAGVVEEVKKEVMELFFCNPPLLLNEAIESMLYELAVKGYTLSIGSNTGFIEGDDLDRVLKMMGIKDLFNFRIYSDQIGYSKPSPHFFEAVYNSLNCSKEEVLHVGDNPLADGAGAQKYGFSSLLILNRNYSIQTIIDSIHEKN